MMNPNRRKLNLWMLFAFILVCSCAREEYDILVQAVRVTHIKPGYNWDQDNKADLYFEIFKGNTLVYHQDSIVWNAVTTLPHDFVIEEFTIEDVEAEHTFLLLDYDPIGVDTIEMIKFIPGNKDSDDLSATPRLSSPEQTEIEMEVMYVLE